ncbi:MAG: DNA replication/repair protein RecF [Bdellovibrionales bacterium]|nr:DNA replication/repair protein RecF [Bdellovibrionales bacterium]
MRLERLEVAGFRNLANQVLPFPKRVTSLIGRNGQGKTSVLEAVYLLAHAKSFRSSRIRELVSWDKEKTGDLGSKGSGAPDCFVAGTVATAVGEKRLRCEIRGGKRSVFLNENRIQSAGSFYGQLNCLVFTPDELQLVKGLPAGRRSFLDRLLAMSSHGYVEHLVAYQRALKHRNKLLSQTGGTSSSGVRQALAAWDQVLAEHGAHVVQQRLQLTQALAEQFSARYQRVAAGAKETVTLRFLSQCLEGTGPLAPAELVKRYQERWESDLRRRTTTFGVHRDDLGFFLESNKREHPARSSASQGQARSIALSLKLSAIQVLRERTEEDPVLLLDDVESELDAGRQQAFYDLLHEFSSQIIITSTDRSKFLDAASVDAHVIEIHEGRISS